MRVQEVHAKLCEILTVAEYQLGGSVTSGSFGRCETARLGLLAALWFDLGHGGGRTALGGCYLRAWLAYGARYRGDSCPRRTWPWRVRASYELGETSDERARAVSEGERRTRTARRDLGLRSWAVAVQRGRKCGSAGLRLDRALAQAREGEGSGPRGRKSGPTRLLG